MGGTWGDQTRGKHQKKKRREERTRGGRGTGGAQDIGWDVSPRPGPGGVAGRGKARGGTRTGKKTTGRSGVERGTPSRGAAQTRIPSRGGGGDSKKRKGKKVRSQFG